MYRINFDLDNARRRPVVPVCDAGKTNKYFGKLRLIASHKGYYRTESEEPLLLRQERMDIDTLTLLSKETCALELRCATDN